MGASGWERVRPVDVGAVVELARAGESNVQLDALEALATLRLDADAWRDLSWTIVGLLRGATPASEERRRLIDVAASIPLVTVQREIQRIADSRTDPDRVAALPGLARYGLVKPVHVRRLLRDGVEREVLAALPLEDAGLDPEGFEVASLSNGNEPDDDARLWGAIAAGRAGALAALDRELDRLATGESQPHLFDGSPWTAYDRLAAVRPLPAPMDAHLLTRPPSLVVWALTGSADAEGTPVGDDAPFGGELPDAPPSPAEAGATVMQALRAAGTRPDFVAGNDVVRLALSFPALELPTKELLERCGYSAASPRQLAWLAGRGGLRRAAIAIDEKVAAAVSPERAREALAFLRDVALAYTANPFEGSGGGDASSSPRLDLVDDTPPPPMPPPSVEPPGGTGFEFGVRAGDHLGVDPPPTPPPAPAPTTPSGERHYKAWFSNEVEGWRDLHVQVDASLDGNVLQGGLTRVGDEEVPAAGLATSWLVRAGRRPLRSTDPAVRVESAPVNGVEEWFARFELLVPPSGPSEERTLGVSADGGPVHLDVMVMVDMRPYRDFTITMDRFADEERADRRFLDEQAAAAPPPAEEPADRALILVHGPGESHLLAEVGADRYDTRAGWPSEAQLSGLVRNVRGAADRWRAEASSLLDALEPADVDRALALPLPTSWRDDPGPFSAEHDERWRAAAGSTVLRELASHGRALYDVLFPPDTPSRTVLDTMEPGAVLSISWTADTDGFAGAIPWTLLYTGPYDRTAPVDPTAFLGLQLRIKYTFFEPPDPSTSLAADHGFTNVLYWGESDGDVTGQQAAWQRSWMTGLRPSARLLPSSAAARRDEVVDALTTARDASVVYLFCQCGVTSEGGSAVLTFDDADAASQIADWELRGAPLPNHPLVFANACDTGRASVYEINAVLALFMARQCRAYIGTEAKIPIVLGSRVARIFFHYFTVEGLSAGEALARTRRLLWLRFRNPGGLLYSYINQYDLRLAAVGEG